MTLMAMWWKKITFRKYFMASFILGAVSIVAIFAVKSFLPPVVPLYYGRPGGAAQLAPLTLLFLIPLVSIVISVINILVSRIIADEFIKKLLAIASLTVSFMATITLIKIILLVGFF